MIAGAATRPDTRARAVGYYVSVRNGSRSGLLLGPYPSNQVAEQHVDRARHEAELIDPWAGFYGFGTARATTKPGRALPPGRLNNRIGLYPTPNKEGA